jgi:hypothetical protein
MTSEFYGVALGGLPAAPIRYNKNFGRTPLQYLTVSSRPRPPKGEDGFNDYMFYIVTPDGFTIGSQPTPVENTKSQMIVDSGSTLTYLPKEVVRAIHDRWTPPVSVWH